jgi:hypothetical protein
MGESIADVKRVMKTAAELEAGGIILGQLGFATDTNQAIMRMAAGYRRLAGIAATNSFSALNTFSAGLKLPSSQKMYIGDINNTSIEQDGSTKTSIKGETQNEDIAISPGGSGTLILNDLTGGVDVKVHPNLVSNSDPGFIVYGRHSVGGLQNVGLFAAEGNGIAKISGMTTLNINGNLGFTANKKIFLGANDNSEFEMYHDGNAQTVMKFNQVNDSLLISGPSGSTGSIILAPNGSSAMTIEGTDVYQQINITDQCNFIFGTTNGTKFGGQTTQKIGFWNATPVVQPSGAAQAALIDSSGGVPSTTISAVSGSGDDATLNNNFASILNLLNEIRTNVLVSIGLMKGSA